ncbi:hypothetical protein ACFW2Y_30740 [Streptomyces sp. NPDC058877]|uniref:hypothetical protein n=1 Tax=unclassified Streptomyces TaxID=2593676 RepID=UPI0036C96C43
MPAHETLGAGRGTFFDKRADGTFGPVEEIKIDVLVTPGQWDALGRISAPGSLASGAQKAMQPGPVWPYLKGWSPYGPERRDGR